MGPLPQLPPFSFEPLAGPHQPPLDPAAGPLEQAALQPQEQLQPQEPAQPPQRPAAAGTG